MRNLSLLFVFSLLFSASLFSQNGLKGQYYNGINFDKLVLERIDTKIDFSWPAGFAPSKEMDPSNFSARWTGMLSAPEDGTYTFSTVVDDGIRVWVGGVLVIDAWSLNDNIAYTGKVRMKAGKKYPIKVEYFNGLLEGEVKLFWELPSIEYSWFEKAMGTSKATIVPAHKFSLSNPIEKPAEKPDPTPKPTPKPKIQPTVQATPPPSPIINKKPIVVDTLEQYLPKNIYFKQSKPTILVKSYGELDKLAEMLTRHKNLDLTINGHTDNLGDADLNMKLSKDRAKTVARYLIKKGIDAQRIQAYGYGGTRPIYTDDTPESRAKNRRVEFELSE